MRSANLILFKMRTALLDNSDNDDSYNNSDNGNEGWALRLKPLTFQIYQFSAD